MSNSNLTPPSAALADLPATAPTCDAAPTIGRKPQTLRKWACTGTGPIRPIRIYGRLHWRVSDLQALLRGEVAK